MLTIGGKCCRTPYFGITPSRLGLTERQRAQRLAEAVQAGRTLQKALEKLDAGDKGRARLLDRQLQRWIEIATAPHRPSQHDTG